MHQSKNPKNQRNNLLNSATHFLKFRPRSRYEMLTFLQKKSADLELVEAVVNHLEELKFINDHQFASDFAHSQLKNHKGPVSISYTLNTKFKVPKTIIDQTIQALDPETLHQTAANALKKYHYKLKKYPKPQRKHRAYQYLYQRGFSSSTITSVIDEFTDEE